MSRILHPLVALLLLALVGPATAAVAATWQDFDSPGTPYVIPQYGCDPPVEIIPGGPWGNFARLASADPVCFPHTNGMDFDLSDPGTWSLVVAEFDFRMTPPTGANGADGMGFALLDTFWYGDSGEAPGQNEEDNAEEPNFFGSIGVGFDIWESDVAAPNQVSLHWDQGVVAEETTAVALEGGAWIHAQVVIDFDRSEVTVRLAPYGGELETVIDHVLVDGLAPYEGRVHFGARSGGLTADHDLDNVHVRFSDDPVLSAFGECPGPLSVTLLGATPDAPAPLLAGPDTGSLVIPPGLPCEGTELGLSEPQPLSTPTADVRGEVVLGFDSPPSACGRYLQALDRTACEPSDVAVVPTTAATLGRWSEVMDWPVIAIHTQLLPDGRVLLWDRHGEGWDGDPYLWDPATDTFTQPPPLDYDIFCAGFAFLDDGRLLVAGGHVSDEVGSDRATIFDPVGETWETLPAMNDGRWYPTATTLGDGSVLVTAGTYQPGATNPLPQVWEPASGAWRDLTGAEHPGFPSWADFYPFQFLMPDGDVFFAGPQQMARLLDPAGEGAWSEVDASSLEYRDYGSAVLFDDQRVLLLGGNPRSDTELPSATAETIDLGSPTPAWQAAEPMSIGRRHLSSTLLPDGTVLVTGGSSAAGFDEEGGAVLHAESWNPETGEWTSLAEMAHYRGYHSTALLLPDGRVLSAGGGHPGSTPYPDAELYSPPYLFRGERPSVTDAPGEVVYGESFTVSTPDAERVAAVHWLRLGAVTHGFNMSQRIARLPFAAAGSELTVTAPAEPDRVPPGHYLQFLLDDRGVPSVATVVSIGS